ncbi:MAG TPA: hypothetical protein VF183_05560, partial [Acidimicrobiales bacterium]
VLPERNPHEHGDVKRQVLGAILYMGRPLRIDEIAILCGYSAGASTVGTYVSALRKEGLVTPEGVPARGLVDLTAKGRRDATKAPKPLPSEQRITWWCAQLGKHGDVLRLLCEVYPERIHHDTLCKRLSYSKDASTMGTYLSALRKKGLITRERGPVAASPHLFLEPER